MTWHLTMHSHHEHQQWAHHLQTFAWEVHRETSTTFQCSFVLQNTSLRVGPSNSSVRGGVTDTCESVTHWVLTCRLPCALWCHNHMCYKLDFDILSTPKAPLKTVKLCHKTYVNHYPDQIFKISPGHLDHCSIQEWNEMNEHVGSHKQQLPRRSYQ